ncbi:type I phosphomannose isomerase catalytic subunit [Eudoraea chungangensis]|uniref:type I phosphomannose isomerase catalytic subunit n=1 Tax=Eudoraea chungangensis TaxID=1481905 RepID=UPI0023EB3FCB|nr:type I phosphomannose isomerase catalytic subunit [Eudoraea chungangensis]
MSLYPLKFEPILMKRLWGGTRLGTVLGKAVKEDKVGESWEISGVKDHVSIVSNGAYKGLKLTELITKFSKDLLGERVLSEFGDEFPILIKFIDAKKDLSIQLHPDDILAKKRHNSLGKTEMWYVMDAEEESNLIVGFKEDISEEDYKNSLKDNSLLSLLHFETVKEGDTFFINAGKIHAIGQGVLLAEIQQTSDVTYRVFDYNRKDSEGNLRELHTELALSAIDYKRRDDFKIVYEKKENIENPMVNSAYFTTRFVPVNKNLSFDLSERDSFTIYMCVKGNAEIKNENGKAIITKGETVLIPANSKKIHIITKGAELLEITI